MRKSYLARVVHVAVANNSHLGSNMTIRGVRDGDSVQHTSSPVILRYCSNWRKSVLKARRSAFPRTTNSDVKRGALGKQYSRTEDFVRYDRTKGSKHGQRRYLRQTT